ncbi:MAG TPA: exosortase E/protease, VPEID-CTERM system [Gemmataceae bacterium]|jgi:exosortase E/protease (VPEID-CTERM system)|nr:exosortase E/protease, VPEID-CTERM system [Gemmataceae bacterium]
MSILTTEATAPAKSLPIIRWILLAVLLLGELIGLTICFDTASLAQVPTWWADLLGQSPLVPRLALVIAAATFFFSGNRLRSDLEHLPQSEYYWPAWVFVLGHLFAFACFAWTTSKVLGGQIQTSTVSELWVIAWALLGLLTVALWGAAALPPSLWVPLVRRGAGSLVAGLLIGAAAWGAGNLTDFLWPPLSFSTFWVVRALLGLGASEVVCDPDNFVVGTPDFAVTIAPECSGYEGIGLIWVFLAVYLWRSRAELRFPRALLVVPLATGAIWLANSVRIAALIGVGSSISRDIALGGFHSQAGWLAFIAIALGVMALAQRVPFFAVPPDDQIKDLTPDSSTADVTPAYLVPYMVLLGSTMITGLFVAGFDWYYPLRVVLTGAVLWYFRCAYGGPHWTFSSTPLVIGATVFVLWLALEPASSFTSTASDQFGEALANAPTMGATLWLIFRALGSVVTVPLAEELAFRGFLTRRLISTDIEAVPPGRFTWLSFLVSSLLFGLLHERWLAGTLAGMFYALALYRRQRLADAVLAHATTNALLTGYVLVTRSWALWS